MVDVSAFVGLRFAARQDPQLALERVTAPPYDAIDAELAADLRGRSPYNIVRLELASAAHDDDRDRYREAAATYERWSEQHILVRDDGPTMRVYEQVYDLPDGSSARQVGVLVALNLEPWEDGDVLPHERVFPGPVEDRLRLLEALPVNLSPVYVATERHVATARRGLERVMALSDPEQFVDEEDVVHRIWTTADPSVHRVVAESLQAEPVLMADGHHRYTTALEHAARHGTTGRILALLVIPGAGAWEHDEGSEDTRTHDGPWIRPMHRLVRRWPRDADERLRTHGFDLARVASDVATLEHAIEASADSSFGLLTPHAGLLVTPPAAGADVDGLDGLPTVVVDETLTDVLGIDAERDIAYVSGTDRLVDMLANDDVEAVALVRAVGLDEVWSVARSGRRMPPKSTAFFPKPRTGIVLRPVRTSVRE